MASLSPESVVDKLRSVNDSVESIQTVSHWLTYHQKHSRMYIDVWKAELAQANPPQRLRLLYVANELVQSNRKKLPNLVSEFFPAFLETMPLAMRGADEKTQKSIRRLATVWEERQLFTAANAARLKRALDAVAPAPASASSSSSATAAATSPASRPAPVSGSTSASGGPRSQETQIADLARRLDEASHEDKRLEAQLEQSSQALTSREGIMKAKHLAEIEELQKTIEVASDVASKLFTRTQAEVADLTLLVEMLSRSLKKHELQLASIQEKQDEYQEKTSTLNDLKRLAKAKADELTAGSLLQSKPPPVLSAHDIFDNAYSNDPGTPPFPPPEFSGGDMSIFHTTDLSDPGKAPSSYSMSNSRFAPY